MSENWPAKRLGDLCDVITKGTTPTSMGYAFVEEGINFIKVESISLDGSFIGEKFAHITAECHGAFKRSQLVEGDILFSIAGALGRTALVSSEILPANTNQALAIIRLKPSEAVSRPFLVLALGTGLLLEQIEKSKGGVAQLNLSLAQVQDFRIPIPPLPEQQRIVGVLDEAFAGIATAKANAEKNLQNARALFESHLHAVFTHRGPGWVEKPLEECVEKVRYTSKIQRKAFLETGRFPVVSQEAEFINGYWNDEGNLFRPARPLVVFGDHTRTLKFIDFDFVLGADGVKLLLPNPFLDGKFFYYALLAEPVRSLGYARHYRLLAERSIAFPSSVAEQRRITARLDALQTETRRLEALYARKLAALDELKSALLHQAFSGQL